MMKYNTKFFNGFTLFLFVSLWGNAQEDINENETRIKAGNFFQDVVIAKVVTNPTGDLIAYERFDAIYVGGPGKAFKELIADDNVNRVTRLQWVSDKSLFVTRRLRSDGQQSHAVYEIISDQSGELTVGREAVINRPGYILDPLIRNSERTIFAQHKFKNDVTYTDVFNIGLFEKSDHYMRNDERMNQNSGEINSWVTDASHKLYLGVSYIDDIPALWKKNPSGRRFKKIWQAKSDIVFTPYGVSKDGKRLWVLTNLDSDKVVAAEFDIESGTIARTLFQHELVDVGGMFLSEGGHEPYAISYVEKGLTNYEFLTTEGKEHFNWLKSYFKKQQIYVTNFSQDVADYIVLRYEKGHGGKYSFCNTQKLKCEDVGSLRPWLDDVQLADTHALSYRAKDNFQIEYFLTLPNDAKDGIPLVVVPHGGPIGVRDNRHYEPDPQWLAYNGYAVLQVNYRGSGGYGKKFELTGMQQWGRAIEDDIDGALNDVLKRYQQLDSNNICLYGGSYGGYSAIMGIIRSPEIYKCAVSFAGVTDLALLFNRSTVQNNEYLTKRFKEIVGDPVSQRDTLMKYSPVYQYKNITQPLLLIHGTKDDRVDVEHSWRLRRMLQLKGISHEWMIMEGVEHGFKTTDEVNDFYNKVIPFLDKYLKN